MSRSQPMLDALDEGMRGLGSNSLTSDEASALAYGLLVRAISLTLGRMATPEVVQKAARENVEAILDLREGLQHDQEARQ